MAGTISLKSLYSNVVSNLTRDKYRWMSYLDTASRLYKYNFRDSVLIYAQRPDATACASFNLWNRLGRRIRGGAKGIALVDWDNESSMHYVFDESDTKGELKSKPILWKLDDKNNDLVERWALGQLIEEKKDGVPNLVQLLDRVVENRSQELYDGYYKELVPDGESILETLSEDEMKNAFAGTVSESVLYCVLTRCGLQEEYKYSFKNISLFDTEEAISTLGTATNEITNDILVSIEKEIKRAQKERRQEHGQDRDNIQAGRGRAVAQSGGFGGGAQHQSNQIRVDAQAVSERTIPRQIQFPMYEGGTNAALPADRTGGAGDEGHGDGAAQKTVPAAGEDGLHGERPVQLSDLRHGGRDRDPGDRVRQIEKPEDPQEIEKIQEAGEKNPASFISTDTSKLENPASQGSYHITDDNLGHGGPKAKYAANVAAIRMLKDIEGQGCPATREEQEVLSRYVGWGI
jgi:hypothetical protein